MKTSVSKTLMALLAIAGVAAFAGCKNQQDGPIGADMSAPAPEAAAVPADSAPMPSAEHPSAPADPAAAAEHAETPPETTENGGDTQPRDDVANPAK